MLRAYSTYITSIQSIEPHVVVVVEEEEEEEEEQEEDNYEDDRRLQQHYFIPCKYLQYVYTSLHSGR